MRPYEFPDFATAIQQASHHLQYRSKVVHSARWQGLDIASKPEMATHEVTHVSFAVDLAKACPDASQMKILLEEAWLKELAFDIRPNLPWADDHFLERVGGYPINPGTQWAKWPYGNSAAKFLDDRGKFNHNYMERYWPKRANKVNAPTADKADFLSAARREDVNLEDVHSGLMYDYGDLNDVVELLATDPYTRQAYLPVWFPEDTGGGSKRAPCTIGYHFIMRDGKLDVTYQIRSCDFVRHFRDDIYLTVRLLLWVIQQAAKQDERWKDVVPGKFVMSIQSLHLFRNDYMMTFGKQVAEQR